MNAIVVALLLCGQPDTLLIEIHLVETQTRVLVEAVLTEDSMLHLPAQPVGQLLGVSFPSQFVSIAALQAQYPTTRAVWLPLEMRVVIFDPLEVFPATRRARQQTVARTRGAFSLPMRSGPFAAFAVDDSARGLLDVGYSFRGRFALAGRVDDGGAATWAVSLAPSSHLFLSYADAIDRPPNLSARVMAGPLWVAGSWSGASPRADVAGLVRLGAVQTFLSRQYGVITFTPNQHWTVQVAHRWDTRRTAARFTVGPAYASPFSFPITQLR